MLGQAAIHNRLARKFEQDRSIVERRLGHDPLRQLVEQPAKKPALRQA